MIWHMTSVARLKASYGGITVDRTTEAGATKIATPASELCRDDRI
jgi:hypothetical protein